MNTDDLIDDSHFHLANAPWYIGNGKTGVLEMAMPDGKRAVLVFTDGDLAARYIEQSKSSDLVPVCIGGNENTWTRWMESLAGAGVSLIVFDYVPGKPWRTMSLSRMIA
jgi:hypothetical protein